MTDQQTHTPEYLQQSIFAKLSQMNKEESLNELAEQVNTCKKCGLCETAIKAVPGHGNPDADLVFIGEAPGAQEDKTGLPFVGRAGKLLDFMLKQIKLEREDVWIGNIIKHRPPKNRDPFPNEIEACQPYLTKQLEIIKPKVIVTLGRFAMNYFLPDAIISEQRGNPTHLSKFILYPVYHPAAGLRNSKMKTALIEDFLGIPDILSLEHQSPGTAKPSESVEEEGNTKEEQISLF